MMRKIRLLNPEFLPDSGILAANQVSALLSAAEIIETTEAWALNQKEDIQKLCEDETDKARIEGYKEGFLAFRTAIIEYEEATNALSRNIEEVLESCLDRLIDGVRDVDLIKASIKPLLAEISASEMIVIAVHPNKSEALAEALTDMESESPIDREISVEIDSSISEKACFIYTDSDVLSVGPNVLVDQMLGALREHFQDSASNTQTNNSSRQNSRSRNGDNIDPSPAMEPQ